MRWFVRRKVLCTRSFHVEAASREEALDKAKNRKDEESDRYEEERTLVAMQSRDDLTARAETMFHLKKDGLTDKEIAKKFGVSASTVHNWLETYRMSKEERGSPSTPLTRESPVETLYLTVSSQNALQYANAYKIGDVLDLIKEKRLERIRGVGKKRAKEIREKLAAHGFDV